MIEKMETSDRFKQAFELGRKFGELVKEIARNSDEERDLKDEWQRGFDVGRNDTEEMDEEERLKRAYKIGRECGECVRTFDYDPNKGVSNAMHDYEWRVGCDYDDTPQSINIDNDPDLIDRWEDGFIDGYERKHSDEKADRQNK